MRQLTGSLNLREALAALDTDLDRLAPAELIAWADAPPLFPSLAARLLGVALAWGLTFTAVGSIVMGGAWWEALLGFVLLEAVFYLAHRQAARQVAQHVADAGYTLGVLHRLSGAIAASQNPPAAATGLAGQMKRCSPCRCRCAELYGLFLQNSFLHALKIQGMPLWEAWRLRTTQRARRPGRRRRDRSTGRRQRVRL